MRLPFLGRWFQKYRSAGAARRARSQCRASRRRASSPITAEVEVLQPRQMPSGAPALNTGVNSQGKFNITIGGNDRSDTAGNFSSASLTFTNPNQTINLPFAYCIHIEIPISLNTTYTTATYYPTDIYDASNPPSGNPAVPGYVIGFPTLAAINTNAMAFLASQFGPLVGNVNANGTNYLKGMALQAALWKTEFEAPTPGVGWPTSPYAPGTLYTLTSISPLKFPATPISDFDNAYQAEITALNAAYLTGGLTNIAAGVLFINAFNTNGTPAQPLISATSTLTIGHIQGVKFFDHNGDGHQAPGDQGMPNWTIYLDLNHNGSLDPGEPSTVTDAIGNWSFTGLTPDVYDVREVMKSGWYQTTPNLNVTISLSDFIVTGQGIGNNQFLISPKLLLTGNNLAKYKNGTLGNNIVFIGNLFQTKLHRPPTLSELNDSFRLYLAGYSNVQVQSFVLAKYH